MDRRNRRWLMEFYKSLLQFDGNGQLAFRQSMRDLIDVSQAEWEDENVLLTRIWCEEFFLARYEAAIADESPHYDRQRE